MKLSERMKEVIKLKEQGCSDLKIAKKFGVSRQNISQALQRAKKHGYIWKTDGENISSQTEEQPEEISLEGEKPKLKGSFRCPYCKKALIPIGEVAFNPHKIKVVLVKHGFSHVCITCKKAFTRETTEQSGFVCAECSSDVVKVSYKGTILYFCGKCRALYDKDELKEETEKEEIE